MFHVKQFQEATGVSMETLHRLQAYADLLEKWQKTINLVGSKTIFNLWNRHMLDSAQLLPLLPRPECTIIDFGSGAGFPGLVLAIMGCPRVIMVESDRRKCAFLAEAVRKTDAASSVNLQNCRIEESPSGQVDVVIARGLAPLEKLLALAEPFLRKDSMCLFLKGKKADEELTKTEKNWMMKVTKIQSKSDPSGTVVKLENVKRRG
jgi:16S rRNA (guanine527-N7)-methyltransferase